MRLRIRNGHIVDPANGIDAVGDVCIAAGKIVSVLAPNPEFTSERVIDAARNLVIPGMVDLCARFREPGAEHKATIASESKAATSAGVTSVCCPPDTRPVIDTPAVVELIHQRAQLNNTRIFPLGALTHGLASERLAEMQTLMKAGCVGVSNGIQSIPNTEVLRRAMEYAAGFAIPVYLYPEDYYLRNEGVIHEGATSTRLGLPPIPATAESVAVSQALLLLEQTGGRLHLGRLSSARSVELIAAAKKRGLPVTADTGICHLHLCDTDIGNYDTSRHLIPPLRGHQDRQALRAALAEGVIDAVCSDHQPHDDDAKAAPFSETESGASTIEVLFPLLYRLVLEKSLTLTQAVTAVTARPAGILGIDQGTLSVGAEADLAIIDLGRSCTVSREQMLSTGKNTPFTGWQLTSQVTHTLVHGRMVYEAT
ncbi:MAG: dihydroorotase [Gammaproteobacteria bacterium]|nr:dihydroorotase [Gammaproteobacteria bacterium]